MMNRYLETLTKTANDQKTMSTALRRMSFSELAKLAGVKLAQNVCESCGSTMEKKGSVLRCTCGMMKSAGVAEALERGVEAARPYLHLADDIPVLAQKVGLFDDKKKKTAAADCCKKLPQEELEGRLKKVTGESSTSELSLPADKGSLGQKTKTLPEKTAGFAGQLLNIRANAPVVAKKVIKGAPPAAAQQLTKVIKKAPPAALAKAAAVKRRLVKKVASDVNVNDTEPTTGLEAQKTAAMPGMGQIATGAKNLMGGAKGLAKGLMGKPSAGLTTGMTRPAAQMANKGLSMGQTARGVMKKNPLATAGVGMGVGAAGAAALGGGGGNNQTVKIGSAELMEIGDRAGRMLAKTAGFGDVQVTPDELEESIQEAQDREDIPGRAKNWQVGGGVGGGLLGAAPGIAAALIGRRLGPKSLGRAMMSPKVTLPLAGAGGAAGAMLGQSMGKQHGAEEAAADKAVSLLRALRAHQAGAQSGFGEGLRQGSAFGGSSTEKDSEFGEE